MCKICETKPVYEFTNQRKLCEKCFVEYFQKKFLYTIRKFQMIKPQDKVGYFSKSKKDLKEKVLLEMLNFLSNKSPLNIIKIKSKKDFSLVDKIAITSSIDSESGLVIDEIVSGDASKLKKYLPKAGKVIKPLYSFLDEEILLFAKIKKMDYSLKKREKGENKEFIDSLEKKHPEIKRAIIHSLLKLYSE